MSPGRAWRAGRGRTAALVAAGFSSLVANPDRIRRWILLSFLLVGEAVRRADRPAARQQQDHDRWVGGLV